MSRMMSRMSERQAKACRSTSLVLLEPPHTTGRLSVKLACLRAGLLGSSGAAGGNGEDRDLSAQDAVVVLQSILIK